MVPLYWTILSLEKVAFCHCALLQMHHIVYSKNSCYVLPTDFHSELRMADHPQKRIFLQVDRNVFADWMPFSAPDKWRQSIGTFFCCLEYVIKFTWQMLARITRFDMRSRLATSTRVWRSPVRGAVSTSSIVSRSRSCRSWPCRSSASRTLCDRRKPHSTSCRKTSRCRPRSASSSQWIPDTPAELSCPRTSRHYSGKQSHSLIPPVTLPRIYVIGHFYIGRDMTFNRRDPVQLNCGLSNRFPPEMFMWLRPKVHKNWSPQLRSHLKPHWRAYKWFIRAVLSRERVIMDRRPVPRN